MSDEMNGVEGQGGVEPDFEPDDTQAGLPDRDAVEPYEEDSAGGVDEPEAPGGLPSTRVRRRRPTGAEGRPRRKRVPPKSRRNGAGEPGRPRPGAPKGKTRRRREAPGQVPSRKKGSGLKRGSCLRGCVSTLIVLLFLGVVASGILWWTLYRVEYPKVPGQSVRVEIRQGEGTYEIAETLAKAGVVDNSTMFRLQAEFDETDNALRPGVYDLKTGMDYGAVIDQLTLGPPIKYVTISIPEGFTVDQIAKRVEEETGIPASEFSLAAKTGHGHFSQSFLDDNTTRSLEGYLFPKTYLVREGASAEEILSMMLDQFGEEFGAVDMSWASQHGLTVHDVVIVASMIEREAKVARDRPIIASVIYNRLRRGMRLEIDATVQYILGNKKRLLYRDLRVDSPYNTYLRKGLPPGPIANPGLASLKAAAKPRNTGYYFYVLTHRNGAHSFAKTEAEFLRLKARAKQGLR